VVEEQNKHKQNTQVDDSMIFMFIFIFQGNGKKQ